MDPRLAMMAACKVCGVRVTMLEAPLHIEDHKQRNELPPSPMHLPVRH